MFIWRLFILFTTQYFAKCCDSYSSFLQTTTFSDSFVEVKNYNNCMCVPYWQCKEDFSGLVEEDGSDILDIRVFRDNRKETDLSASCTGDFDVCCKVECGRLNNGLKYASPKFRILEGGGSVAEFAEFPWMLGLLQNRAYVCGASLIHPQVAITAAHCVSNLGKFKVRAGEWNWASNNEPIPHQDRFTKRIIIHPHYDPSSLRNDIAILILDNPLKLTENVGVVCLPPYAKRMKTRRRCTASGWGKNSHTVGTYQSTLKKVDLPIMPIENCLHSLRRARLGASFNLHSSFICAGGEMHKDTCKGDGGSPLICPVNDDFDRYEQTGIVSWGLTCGIQNTPGVYVNVALFTDWIDEELNYYNFDTQIYKISE
ncbi:PREDICTED: trypsin-3-like isoform X1 [Nicrophorus vespilloides]|uniref:Trypsin-3-like isoform X1 n=1 Tax=Nicrophorus vespilloides TaxID=110193 RepID=A0ABM1N8M9_NICVS|nr:PREDICTED: trypsin-3-like isoform X1 [Nicrophorus vespilloides]